MITKIRTPKNWHKDTSSTEEFEIYVNDKKGHRIELEKFADHYKAKVMHNPVYHRKGHHLRAAGRRGSMWHKFPTRKAAVLNMLGYMRSNP